MSLKSLAIKNIEATDLLHTRHPKDCDWKLIEKSWKDFKVAMFKVNQEIGEKDFPSLLLIKSRYMSFIVVLITKLNVYILKI